MANDFFYKKVEAYKKAKSYVYVYSLLYRKFFPTSNMIWTI